MQMKMRFRELPLQIKHVSVTVSIMFYDAMLLDMLYTHTHTHISSLIQAFSVSHSSSFVTHSVDQADLTLVSQVLGLKSYNTNTTRLKFIF